MATSWTNPISPGTPIRAFDIQEVRNAINAERTALGWIKCPFTDGTLVPTISIKARHFTEMRGAIQDLWYAKSMGPVSVWSKRGGADPSVGTPIYATDLTDLRGWLNQYQNHA